MLRSRLNPKMPLSPVLVALLALAACMPFPGRDEVNMATTGPVPDTLHSFTIDRAYTLADPRESEFREQIAAEARQRCGAGDYSLYSQRPVGVESVRDDFLYRQHDVQITCDG